MIPIRLEIEGLYSYKERQVIEFERLTAAGLFGIFGAVGSGKSSILEAILIALYGSPERVSSSGERGSMIHLQSPQVVLHLIFRTGKNNEATYKAQYSAKRNKKDPEKIESGDHIIYQQVGQEWEPTQRTAEELVGMSKENFKQTIIIPQGKFRAFIDQKPLDRAEMMQQLFGLDRFDLSAPTGSLLKVAKEGKIRLETQLGPLQEIAIEALEAKEGEVKLVTQEALTQGKKVIQGSERLKKLDLTRKYFLQLKALKEAALQLQAQVPRMQEKKKQFQNYRKAKTYLKPVWDRIQDTKKDLEKYQVSFTDCTRFKKIYAEELATLMKEEQVLREKNELRPQREAKIRDLKKVLEIQELRGRQATLQTKLEELSPKLQVLKEKSLGLEKQIQSIEAQQELVPQADPTLLAQLNTFLDKMSSLEERISGLNVQLQAEEKELQNRALQLQQWDKLVPTGAASLEEGLHMLQHQVKDLEGEKDRLLKTQGLSSHAHLLVAGQACPLCGASEHPQPLNSSETEDSLRSLEEQLKKNVATLEVLRDGVHSKKLEEIQLANSQKNLADKKQELQRLCLDQEGLIQSLTDLGIADKKGLEERLESLNTHHQHWIRLHKELDGLRKEWHSQRGKVAEEEKALQNILLQNQDLFSRISTQEQAIHDLEFCQAFFQKSQQEIHGTIAKVERDIEEAAKDLLGIQKHIDSKKSDQSKNEADLKNFEKEVNSHQKKWGDLQHNFEALMTTHGFTEEQELIHMMELDLDVDKLESELQDFDQQLASTTSKIQELEAEEGVLSFSEEQFQVHQQELLEDQEKEKEILSKKTLLEKEVEEITSKLEEKNRLTQQFLELETREAHLLELEKLFSGKGFVKYVSSIYLRELCNTANKRFMKLTKNSLSLEIDDSNTFWVIDYLNGGKKRLLKTLSGGQTFQASLCLALALAEKVKMLNQADQSFFFLDEGFGALDKTSLRVVFETLKSLRHENRIVGIISHVEELQQEIGVYAQIDLDPELGSQVSYSF